MLFLIPPTLAAQLSHLILMSKQAGLSERVKEILNAVPWYLTKLNLDAGILASCYRSKQKGLVR